MVGELLNDEVDTINGPNVELIARGPVLSFNVELDDLRVGAQRQRNARLQSPRCNERLRFCFWNLTAGHRGAIDQQPCNCQALLHVA